MTPETQRSELIAAARAALELEPEEVERAHHRLVARLDADAQRGGWRNTTELRPFLATWLRTLVLGTIGVAVVSLGWWRCPLYELSVAEPHDHVQTTDQPEP
jgi:hypothetical protein